MADDARTTTSEDPLAWEARNGARAGWCAIAAAVCTVVGAIVRGLAQSGVPKAQDRTQTVIDTLSRTASGQPIPPGRVAAVAEYIGTHRLPFILAGVLLGLGGLLSFPPLAYLFRAARARVPANRLGLIGAAVGAAGYGIGSALLLFATAQGAASFVGGSDRSNAAANDALGSATASTAQLARDLGGLALALAFVLIALGAMRAGLLTRFLGFLGAIVGASLVLPLDQLGIIRSFWLGSIGVLLLNLRPERRPPAWAVAEAVPWPSQQQVRERREAARQGRGGRDASPGGGRRDGSAAGDDRAETKRRGERVPQPRAPQPRRATPTGARPHPSSKKRKRKRR